MGEIIYNIPKNNEEYKGQFIVFFSNRENPEILFNSFIAEEAYKEAEKIFKEQNIKPTVILVENRDNNLAQVMAIRHLRIQNA